MRLTLLLLLLSDMIAGYQEKRDTQASLVGMTKAYVMSSFVYTSEALR